MTTSNPVPSGPCGNVRYVSSTFSGTIQNNGDDLASNAAWQNVTGEHGSTTLTKTGSDVPISETTNAVGFSVGNSAYQGQFRQVLNTPSGFADLFKGRQVYETNGSGLQYDNCWFPGAIPPKWSGVTGSSWNVGYYATNPPWITSENEWGADYIGYSSASVQYYRTHLLPKSFPCGAQVPQFMYIATAGTSGSREYYTSDQVGAQIRPDHIAVTGAGVTQTTFK